MTRAERLVLLAARRWAEAPAEPAGSTALIRAVEALKFQDGTEAEVTYGELATGDEVWSPATAKWYEVLETVLMGNGMTKVRLRGINGTVIKAPDTPIKARRGPLGQAVDMFATVLRSGPSGGSDEGGME